jgi:hypothetical protein
MSQGRALTFALVAAVFVLGTVVGLEPLRSHDYFWHLRTGEQILANGEIPKTDSYTFTVRGSRWIDMHWTFQVGVYSLYELGGHTAVRIAKALGVVALLALVGSIAWRRERATATALALGLMVMAAHDRLFERPELVSFLILAGVLALLDVHRRRGGNAVFWIVPLILLWANVHGLFAVGIALCAMALAAELARPWWGRAGAFDRDRARRLALVTLASIAASFINPNGFDAVRLPFEQLGMIGLAGRSSLGVAIHELRPLYAVPGGWITLAVAASLAYLGVLANWRRVDAFDLLVLVSFTYLAISAQRNVALLAIAAVPIAVRNLGDALEGRRIDPRASLAFAAAVLMFLGFEVVRVVRGPLSPLQAAPVAESRFPVAAVDWIERERPPGPLFHAMPDGGYLIWRLFGDYPVMVDGRLEVFGPVRFSGLRTAIAGRPEGFRRLDEIYRFGTVMVHYRFLPLHRLLRSLNRSVTWRLVAIDDDAALFVRIESALGWPDLDRPGQDPLPPLEIALDRGTDLEQRARRFDLLMALDRPEIAKALESETCAHYRGEDTGPFRCGPPAS